MIGDFIAAIVGGVIGEGISWSVWQRRAQRARAAGKALGAIRVREGSAPGLWEQWHSVEVAPSEGAISYEAWTVKVTAADRRSAPLSGTESHGLEEPSPVILEVQSDRGRLDWALADVDVDWVMRKLFPQT